MPVSVPKEEQRSFQRNNDAARGNDTAARTLAVLDAVAHAPQQVGVREIARQLGLAPSVVQRMVNSMTDAGYLEQCRDSLRYRVGYRAFQAGSAYLSGTDLGNAAAEELQALTRDCGVNTYLGVLREGRVVYLLCLRSNSPLVINSVPGSRAFVHSTAFGKALMSDHSPTALAAALGPEPWPQLTPATRTTAAAFAEDVRRGRELGFFIADAENLPNVLAVGAPVRDAAGEIVAAISAAAPSSEIGAHELPRLCQAVRDTAARISRRLGAPMRS